MTGKVRIISGQWRGRRLQVADRPGLRPSTDRTRETLFNWIGPDLPGSRCLDLFAGSGALGLEAVSRGAAGAVLVDSDSRLCALLGEQIATWPKSESVEIVCCDALDWLRATSRVFNLVFVDPPFDLGLQSRAVEQIVRSARLGPDGLIYVESPKHGGWDAALPAEIAQRLQLRRSKIQGRTRLDLLALTGSD